VARGVFLESLEPYILSERIGCLTAPVMRDLLSYFQENGMMDSVEGCLVHMDITNLDIQQVCMCMFHICSTLSSVLPESTYVYLKTWMLVGGADVLG